MTGADSTEGATLAMIDRLIRQVDRDRVVRNARALISTGQPGGAELPRAELVAHLLDHPRVDVLIDPVLPGRPNVIARVRGASRNDGLLLNAHLNSGHVLSPSWQRDPMDPWEADGRLFGGGVSDMLGGLAAMIEAMIVAADESLPNDLTLLASMHHDSNGVGTKYALANDDDWPRRAINGEPTGLTLATRHGGCIKFEVRFEGSAAHVSRLEDGRDALAAAVSFVADLQATGFESVRFPGLPDLPVFQIGSIQGGTDASTMANEAIVQGDLRTVPGMTWNRVRTDLEGVLARSAVDGVGATVRCLVRQRPFIGPTGGPLMSAIVDAHRHVRGVDVEIDTNRGAQRFVSDASDLTHAGIETLVYGPAVWRAEPNESIEIDEMVDAARVYLAASVFLRGQA